MFLLHEILNEFRFKSFNISKAFEIFGIESQQIFDVVRFHRSNDFCIVDLNAGNGMF